MSLALMQKMEKYGSTLVEIQEERERVLARRRGDPAGALSEVLARQAEAQATRRPRTPPRLRTKQYTEAQQLLAAQPQSSAQVIGYHKVPELPPVQKPKKELDELGRMRTIFPLATSQEVGFHHDFTVERDATLRSATRVGADLRGIEPRAARDDPEMVRALSKLRERVHQLDVRRVPNWDA